MLNKILNLLSWANEINEDKLKATLETLERGNTKDFQALLYQPISQKIEYLPITTEMLLKLKSPDKKKLPLIIHERICRKKCSLIILDKQWEKNESRYYPILIQNSSCKIIGIMLPFNELHGKLSKQEYSEATDLGVEWTGFIVFKNFK